MTQFCTSPLDRPAPLAAPDRTWLLNALLTISWNETPAGTRVAAAVGVTGATAVGITTDGAAAGAITAACVGIDCCACGGGRDAEEVYIIVTPAWHKHA